MITLAQDKALEFVFCNPINEGLWSRVMNDKLVEEDEVWDVFSGQDIKTLVKDLYINFQDTYNTGFQDGLTYEGE